MITLLTNLSGPSPVQWKKLSQHKDGTWTLEYHFYTDKYATMVLLSNKTTRHEHGIEEIRDIKEILEG